MISFPCTTVLYNTHSIVAYPYSVSVTPKKKKMIMKNIMILAPRTTIQINMFSNIGCKENAVLHFNTVYPWLPKKKGDDGKHYDHGPAHYHSDYMFSNIGCEKNAVLHIHTVCSWLKKKKAMMENIMIPDPHTTIQITCSPTLDSRKMLSVVCLLNSGISDCTNFVNMYIYNMYTHAPSTQNLWIHMREVGGWGRDPKKCTGRGWGMGSSTI